MKRKCLVALFTTKSIHSPIIRLGKLSHGYVAISDLAVVAAAVS